MSSKILVYPLELNSVSTAVVGAQVGRPMIRFQTFGTAAAGDSVSICMPIPQNISFADAATYNDAELGFAGGAGMAAARAGLGAGGNIGAGVSAGLGAIAGGIPKSLGNLVQGLSASFTSAGAEVQSAVSIGVGATLNKNITTQFTGTGTRRFSFVFKFISVSSAESTRINDISKAFRLGLYPQGNAYQLQYPSTWTIQFLEGVSGNDIQYLPKLFECYLESMTSTYNSIANIWRTDGSPLDSEITLTFIESRSLTKDDIKFLEDNPYDKSRFLANYNIPNTTATDVTNNSTSPTATTTTSTAATSTTAATTANVNSTGY